MTLIELMIVISLMALLMGTLVFGSGLFGGTNRRAAATLIVVGVRKGLAHANTIGKPVRLAMDFENSRVVLEESSSQEMLRSKEEQDDEPTEEIEQDTGAALLESAESFAEQILSGAVPDEPTFSPTDVLGQDGELPGRELGGDVRFIKVQTEHDEEAITGGLAYLYFWPGGVTERAIVQLGRRGDDSGLTVEISPLTGRAEIKRGFVDMPEELFSDEEYSERDEP